MRYICSLVCSSKKEHFVASASCLGTLLPWLLGDNLKLVLVRDAEKAPYLCV